MIGFFLAAAGFLCTKPGVFVTKLRTGFITLCEIQPENGLSLNLFVANAT